MPWRKCLQNIVPQRTTGLSGEIMNPAGLSPTCLYSNATDGTTQRPQRNSAKAAKHCQMQFFAAFLFPFAAFASSCLWNGYGCFRAAAGSRVAVVM
jgi:hypothetical protein